jgi:regulator of sigma E protease
MPSIVSETIPGSPAWRAGLQSGDEIVKLGDRENPSFLQLKGGVTLGDMENGIPIIVHRAASGEKVELTLKPEQSQGRGLATIGILNPWTVTLRDSSPVIPTSPAANAKQIKPPAAENAENSDTKSGFQSGDTIVRVNDAPIADFRDLVGQLARSPGDVLQVTVKRDLSKTKSTTGETAEFTFEVAARPLETLGLVMKMGPITAVQPNSPAAKAGLAAGDVITSVNGHNLGDAKTLADWEPDTLSERLRLAALAGETLQLTVDRAGKPVDVTVTPRVPTEYQSVVPPRTPVGVPALGIAYGIENKVVAVLADSPAAAAQIEPGDAITSAEFVFPKLPDSKKTPDELTLKLSDTEANWPAVFDQLQNSPTGTTLELTIERGDEKLTKKLTPVAAEGLFVAERGFLFNPIERIRRANSLSEQVQYGWNETTDALGMVFRFLKKIGTQVPVTALGGPITIAKAAGYSAYDGLPALLIFLTMLSANLAVLNFLPIPLLDGGHMAFLAYEGVRGRPASEKFVVALHTIGFVFIVSLMLFVVALDLDLIPRDL